MREVKMMILLLYIVSVLLFCSAHRVIYSLEVAWPTI